jgi:outer membrane protein TolC
MVLLTKQTLAVFPITAMLLLIGVSTPAQIHSLQELVAASRHYLPVLMQKQALLNGARAGITDARHAFLPSLNAADELTASSANSLPGTYLPLGIIPSTSSGVAMENNYQAAGGNIGILYSEYELDNFGLRNATVQNARAAAGIQQADLDRESYVVAAQIGTLYFTLLKYQYQLGVDKQNILRYQSIDTIIMALTGSGIRAGVDSSLAQAELSKAKVSFNQRLGIINQLKARLAWLTGIPTDQISPVSEQDMNAIPNPALLDNLPDTGSNPLVNYYVREKQYYTANENLVRKSYLPRILLEGGAWGRGSSIDYNNDYKSLPDGFGYQRFNYAIGIAFTYDLFNTVHRRDKLAVSRFQTQASDFALQQEQVSLNSATAQAVEAIKTAEANLKELPLQVKDATDAFNQKMAQYKAGIINLVDLTDATYVLYTAQSSYVETWDDWFLAHLNKAEASGNLEQFIQSIK